MNKSRSMRLACNTPDSFWDEFNATATYLTNLTSTVTLGNKTPFEIWYGYRPSLSHLCEIGCRAFALNLPTQPKVFQRSRPCILISYAPNVKAYRLWDTSSGRIFNSFHIKFIEHLNAVPKNLFPHISILNDTKPTWDAA